MIYRVTFFFFLSVLLSAYSCQHTATAVDAIIKNTDPATVAFYNVENLFDISDDPYKQDEDFTPQGKYHWTSDRYNVKLAHLAEVLDALPGALPAVVGLCEIENRAVLIDLVKEEKLLPAKYSIIHKDSPDERGIDVALLYDSTVFKVEYFYYTTINLPTEGDPYTRDLLYVKGKSNGEILHFFVNHWPSRGGGQEESEKNRIAVANVLESLIGKILDADKQAKILVMGDFNDYPTNKSIAEVLKAGIGKENILFNYMYHEHEAKRGSYYYKGEWGALDQFLGSQALKNGSKGRVAGGEAAHFFYDDLVLFQDKDGVKRPNRTFAGEDYKGGYSDHLPIYITLEWR